MVKYEMLMQFIKTFSELLFFANFFCSSEDKTLVSVKSMSWLYEVFVMPLQEVCHGSRIKESFRDL